ncbi:sigma-70 family RNA polymerase sigma factor [Stenotrophomonas sp. 24(2023)]|uniref:sigma-70 family RNA polymerase sigma factor n=1 Tax=Stenotrophomonas sp. 24(2023) TaxID=3068324 RepID=UPI0027E00BCB|nr:sigma-70 family RNA polymerase sigma factor [Stenotrophomonas sp. 24(2023)]WMJ69828.1 sigma-70 family RNA polymerase sigma factor [Stenotrophomonas sp. 24(2023)]
MPPLSHADAAATATLYTEHQPWLLSSLRQRLRNRADAEDVASETFLRVIARQGLDAIEEPRAYLGTVARNVLTQRWRRRELERVYLEALAHAPPAMAPSAEEQALLLETLHRIAQALDGVSSKARRAFLMSQLDGLTYAQIAATLGVSVSMVRRYMAQGLRQCLMATTD